MENKKEIIKINSIQDYLNAIELYTGKIGYLKGKTLFRGMSHSKHALMPKVYSKKNSKESGMKYCVKESDILDSFMKKSYAFLQNPPRDDDYQKWIAIAQHYGLPTRILDWSESCLVSLFFAVKKLNDKENGVVWAINPSRYKKWFLSNDDICRNDRIVKDDEVLVKLSANRNIHSAFTDKPTGYRYPYFYYPFFIDERMKTQQSVFMVWGNDKMPLDRIENTQIMEYTKDNKTKYSSLQNGDYIWQDGEFLLKLIINKKKKKYIKKQLDLCGINEYSIFPTLDTFGNYLNEQYSFDGFEHL